MAQTRSYPICGFIPPYILEAIANDDQNLEESRTACKHTIQHVSEYTKRRQEAYENTQAATEKLAVAQQPLTVSSGAIASPVQRNIYDCKGTENLPGTFVRSEGQVRGKDRQVNNCYDGLKITHDFYASVFDRNSLDGNGLQLNASVHFNLSGSSSGYNNAFWDGNKKRMVFGDGDHIAFDYFTDSLDVIAHELGHAFVQFSSELEYYSQSGALNESCADIFGSMVEQWYTHQTVDDADWNIGQTLFPVAFTGSALRTFKAGKAYTDDPVFGTDLQPKHMRDLYTGPRDGRGVHINSGIPNHAFYLAANALGGRSWEKAGKVWYKTMTSGKIPPQCDFKTFATVTVEIAGKEFPDKVVQDAIRKAWNDVGIEV